MLRTCGRQPIGQPRSTPGLRLYRLRGDHVAEGDRSPNEQGICADFQSSQFGDGGQIHQSVNGRAMSLFEIQQQIRSTSDGAGRTSR